MGSAVTSSYTPPPGPTPTTKNRKKNVKEDESDSGRDEISKLNRDAVERDAVGIQNARD